MRYVARQLIFFPLLDSKPTVAANAVIGWLRYGIQYQKYILLSLLKPVSQRCLRGLAEKVSLAMQAARGSL